MGIKRDHPAGHHALYRRTFGALGRAFSRRAPLGDLRMEPKCQYLDVGKFLEAIKRRLTIRTVRNMLFVRIGSESPIGPQSAKSIFPSIPNGADDFQPGPAWSPDGQTIAVPVMLKAEGPLGPVHRVGGGRQFPRALLLHS
jgi:hypothetical protein